MPSYLVALPNSENLIEKSISKFPVKKSRDKEEIGKKSALENNRHIGGVEELDGVTLNMSSHFFIGNSDVYLETLEEVNY